MRRSSPTTRHSMSVVSETCATPFTTSSGAWSPPMASTAMVGTLARLPREARAQRRGIDAVLERLAAVHAEDGHLLTVFGDERRIPVHVDLFQGDRDFVDDAFDDRTHLRAEVTIGPPVERETDHPWPVLVDTPRPLKYRRWLAAARPSRPFFHGLRRHPYRWKAVSRRARGRGPHRAARGRGRRAGRVHGGAPHRR